MKNIRIDAASTLVARLLGSPVAAELGIRRAVFLENRARYERLDDGGIRCVAGRFFVSTSGGQRLPVRFLDAAVVLSEAQRTLS